MFEFIVKDGGISMSNSTARARFRKWCIDNPGARLEAEPLLPESAKLRRFFEGAVVPLVAWYQEGMDHRNHNDLERVREWLKLEFNGDMVAIDGQVHKYAKSTKGREVLKAFVERVQDWIMEQYAPPQEALDPVKWKHWKEAVRPFDGPDNYQDYLAELKLLKRI